MAWILEQDKNPPKVLGYIWKACDDKVHWELEQYYQKTIKDNKLGVKMMASEVRAFQQGKGQDFMYHYQFDKQIPEGKKSEIVGF